MNMHADPKETASVIFLEFYSTLVCNEELLETLIVSALAKQMAILHININKRMLKENIEFYNQVIREIELI